MGYTFRWNKKRREVLPKGEMMNYTKAYLVIAIFGFMLGIVSLVLGKDSLCVS